ncbi:elongation factor P maturation arginine rhamnosyltransferase EarP [Uliginosibacterium sp. H3]|uniref:Protein-arginine rhamnosyltransferase n=1 Tax=Uliginosibacterium silvisoli TaxID=3114758 RepID=A0ABU6K3A0_9RHOO|nr:elongation factor P maturation arginine rhamnosyltransferase EarP [Uliginosibacterium sp. H3]
MTGPAALRIDIFCAVIDNFGDAGVCWRLARQLAAEHACVVRLWLDRPDVLAALLPALCQSGPGCVVEGVTIGDWQAGAAAEPAEVVIEAFACNPPDSFVARMAARPRPPVWINLEYLSAEDWVDRSHGLPSKHPQLGLLKHFYFPGFTPVTGGLLKEAGLDAARQAFQADNEAQRGFWRACGVPAPQPQALRVSLFAYENAALPALLDAWAAGEGQLYCAVPAGRSLPAIAGWSGVADLQPGCVVTRGSLQLVVLPFLSQPDYDRLLWACDLNFVRGEDSFVRAQWAQRPFVWHIYQQEEAAHLIKLDAFLLRYEAALAAAPRDALRNFWQAWEAQDGATTARCWPALQAELTPLKDHAASWAGSITKFGDLSSKLLIFCKDLVE